jgi:hypothetical protein
MTPRRYIFVLVGMLMPVAFARAPSVEVKKMTRAAVPGAAAAIHGEAGFVRARDSAQSLRRDTDIRPIYAAEAPR